MSNEKKQAYKFKHTKRDGEPNFLNYSYEIALLKSHEERIKYMSDIDEKYHDSVYLTCMQMGLAKTISNLPTREERKKAWQELPEQYQHSSCAGGGGGGGALQL